MSEETAIGCERWTGKLRNFGSVQNSAKTLCDRGQILPLPEPQFPYLLSAGWGGDRKIPHLRSGLRIPLPSSQVCLSKQATSCRPRRPLILISNEYAKG